LLTARRLFVAMSCPRFLLLLLCLVLLPLATFAQQNDAAATQAAASDPAPAQPQIPEWRSTAGYRFQAIAQTTADLQNLAHAMNLRELCANRRVPDAFVRQQLDRFGRITGREEDCQTLLEY
jgi:hypothetical protein